MKSKNTLTLLTLATASFLTACGSGGGKAPETMPAPAPKLEQEKTPEKGKEQGNEKAPEVAPPAPKAPEKNPEAPKQDNKPQKPEVAPSAPQAPERKPDTPKRDNQPQRPEVSKTDAEVFNKLRVETEESGVSVENLFHLVLKEGTGKIDLGIMQPHAFIGDPKVETLRDLDGKLVGYYGYALVSEQKRGEERADDEKIFSTNRHFFLRSADLSQRQLPAGSGDITYTGKMFYQYNKNPNPAEEAVVSAKYSGKNQRLSMTISGKDGQWRLQEGKNVSNPNTSVFVFSNGIVGGNLAFRGNADDKFRPDGTFTGGFYGKNGSVLIGDAQSEDRDNGWKGVIGATAVPAK
ncbi:hypothetical protein LVJ85_03770 [Neisseria sp. Dent CA1/247]|uniref:transferrin-binding protein-like solute binding protein n=1 Tax=Neisseria sp. Dent CA1/247 TaxID=2912675 RepID=UPI001FD3CAE7|nr:hypothetical protein [Neisseria sp. Dent CA1/247]UOO77607.1 hypothetical protein LVJ85_03770 [Neisseria sp. Dent CA1/247]